jgi:GNAT superfamily N-acetyltransferase
MSKSRFEIRTMNRAEVDYAVDLAAVEGWNPGLNDAEAFYSADPGGFLLGLLDGDPIGCVSAIRYGQRFGFLGFYIVVEAHRGQGYGMQLWLAAMDRLKKRNIGLDGVVDQQANYKKSGFKLAYRNIRYEGIVRHQDCQPEKFVNARDLPVEALCDYDRDFFPAARRKFLKPWLAMPDASSFVWQEDGRIRGLGMIRKCRNGYKVGPLFADRAHIADALFRRLQCAAPQGQSLYLDVPECNDDAVALARCYQMNVVFETARMYTQNQPDLAFDRLFGVTSFELG